MLLLALLWAPPVLGAVGPPPVPPLNQSIIAIAFALGVINQSTTPHTHCPTLDWYAQLRLAHALSNPMIAHYNATPDWWHYLGRFAGEIIIAGSDPSTIKKAYRHYEALNMFRYYALAATVTKFIVVNPQWYWGNYSRITEGFNFTSMVIGYATTNVTLIVLSNKCPPTPVPRVLPRVLPIDLKTRGGG